ncbi:MAG: PepSY-associated TM helix domain-containing protein [Idiomarina sp.]
MKLSVSPALSKRSLKSHSWLGLLVSVLMFLVCFSGTVAVFSQEIQRWEQPFVYESLDYQASTIQTAYETLLNEHPEQLSEHIIIRLPTPDLPRTSITTDHQSWFINEDGSLGAIKSQPFTDFIATLHEALHLPETYGVLLVSLMGALLSALIISGVMAHRRIFKDAFSFRGKSNPQARETDLHNRLSVWGLPFHLMIALTGAYFGLASYLTGFYSDALYDSDPMALFADLYGDIPQVNEQPLVLDIPRAMAQLKEVSPGTQPVFITVEEVGTESQYMLIGSQHMDKLIYSEQYRFDASGNYMNKVGYADGEPGQGAVFSVYRLHFGHFGSEFVKVLYGLLGLALTVICVSGINLWLQKRGKRDALTNLWLGIVWGSPAALAVAGIAQIGLQVSAIPVFWLGVLAAMVYAQWRSAYAQVRSQLIGLTVVALVSLVLVHLLRFGASALEPISILVNSCLLGIALLLIWYWQKTSATEV